MTKTIVLVHGAWLNSRSWEGFKARYEAQGHTVIAPDWPYDDRPPELLRTHPNAALAKVAAAAAAEADRAQLEASADLNGTRAKRDGLQAEVADMTAQRDLLQTATVDLEARLAKAQASIAKLLG